jgi:hypothetical protein
LQLDAERKAAGALLVLWTNFVDDFTLNVRDFVADVRNQRVVQPTQAAAPRRGHVVDDNLQEGDRDTAGAILRTVRVSAK